MATCACMRVSTCVSVAERVRGRECTRSMVSLLDWKVNAAFAIQSIRES
jgi:hypothetical protein